MIRVIKTNLRAVADIEPSTIIEIASNFDKGSVIFCTGWNHFSVAENIEYFEKILNFRLVTGTTNKNKHLVNLDHVTNIEHLSAGGSILTFNDCARLQVLETINGVVTLRRKDGSGIGTGQSLKEICEANRYGLDDANLEAADLQGADLKDANLRGANLSRADLQSVNMVGAKLTDATLKAANLWHANLQKSNFHGANLQDANLTTANLKNADLRNANLKNTCLEGLRLS